jgi:hypothetical protein
MRQQDATSSPISVPWMSPKIVETLELALLQSIQLQSTGAWICDDDDICTVDVCGTIGDGAGEDVAACCHHYPSSFCQTSTMGSLDEKLYYYHLIPHTVHDAAPVTDGNDEGWMLSPVSDSDDGPLQKVTLDFRFPFYHKTYPSVWVSPNGFVQFHSTFCGGSQRFCPFDEDHGFITPFHTDFNPSASTTSQVRTLQTSRNITVRWDSIEFYQQKFTETYQTFDLVMWDDGTATFHYTQIKLPSLADGYGSERHWSVGFKRLAGEAIDPFLYDSNELQKQQDEDGDVGSRVATGESLTFCRVPTLGCVSSSCGSPGTTVKIVLEHFSCEGEEPSADSFECWFGNVAVNVSLTREGNIANPPLVLNCLVPDISDAHTDDDNFVVPLVIRWNEVPLEVVLIFVSPRLDT